MIIREPVEFVVALVNTRWVEANGLVVGYIPPAFAVSCQQFWVEAPSYNGARNKVIVSVHI